MVKTLSIEELYEKFQALGEGELILDVRTPDEFAEGHVPGSRNISHESVALHADELKKFKNVYIYCRAGGRVQMACLDLVHQGLENLSGVVSGGMPHWIARGFPVEK